MLELDSVSLYQVPLKTFFLVFSHESNSTITNVCSSVRSSAKPLNSLKSSSYIINHSTFIILLSSFVFHPSSFFIHPSFISRLLSFSACYELNGHIASTRLFDLVFCLHSLPNKLKHISSEKIDSWRMFI